MNTDKNSTVKITTLTDRESRVFHAIERSIAHWSKEVWDRSYIGRDEDQRDLCVSALQDFEEIMNSMLGHEV